MIGKLLRPLLCVAAVIAAIAITFNPGQPAFAHAALLSSAPAAGVTLVDRPTSFRLDFTEPVSPLVMRLVQPDGEVVLLATAAAADNSVTVPAPSMAQPGSYILSWRVVSRDGHPVGGTVNFAIGQPSSGVSAPSDARAGAVHVAIWAAQFVLAIGLFVGAGGAAVAGWLVRSRPMPGGTLIIATLIAGIIAAIASLPFQGLDALAEPFSHALRPAVWAAGFRSSWGSTVVIAVLTLAAGILALRLDNRAAAKSLGALAVLGIGFALVASGHATTADRSWSVPAIFLHGICVAFWVGSLWPLAATVRSGDFDALQRFSRLIPMPLVVLVASGIVLTTVEFDRLDAFWTTGYGLVLAAKLAIVLLMLALGALNRYVLVPRLVAKEERQLVAVIVAEVALAIAILGLVGLWRFTPPPRTLAAAETTYIHFHADPIMAQIDLRPERGRGASAEITISDDDLHPIAAREVTVEIWNSAAGIEPLQRDATAAGDGRWKVSGLHIPIAGVWRMRVEVLISDFDKVMLEDNVELPRAP